MRRGLVVLASILCLAISSTPQSRARQSTLDQRLERANQEVMATTRDYITKLENVLMLQEADAKTASDIVAKRKVLVAQKAIDPEQVESAERFLAQAREKVSHTRKQIAEAELLWLEASNDKLVKINRHKAPYDKKVLLKILKLNALPEVEIRNAIQKRGVDFRMSAADEFDFSLAGASPELLTQLRTSYRPD